MSKTIPHIPTVSLAFPVDLTWLKGQLNELGGNYEYIRLNIMGTDTHIETLSDLLELDFDEVVDLAIPAELEEQNIVEISLLLNSDEMKTIVDSIDSVSDKQKDAEVLEVDGHLEITVPSIKGLSMEAFTEFANSVEDTYRSITDENIGDCLFVIDDRLYTIEGDEISVNVIINGSTEDLTVKHNETGEDHFLFDAMNEHNDFQIVADGDDQYTTNINLVKLDFIPQVIVSVMSNNWSLHNDIPELSEEEYPDTEHSFQ